MKKLILSLVLSGLASTAIADVDIVENSHSYAHNEQAEKLEASNDNSVFVLSDNEQINVLEPEAESTTNEASSKLQLLFSKIESLQQELAELRGRVEVQAHQLEKAGLTEALQYKGSQKIKPEVEVIQPKVDLPKNVAIAPEKESISLAKAQNIEIKKTNHLSELSDRTVSNDPMDEQLNYVAAYEHVKHKRYNEAIPAMRQFIASYPDGPYVANAHYWLGELYGVNGDYEQALSEFKTVINDFSDSNKLSAAQYKLGVTYEKIGKKELAQSEFIKVTEAFPGSAVARLAKAKLK